MGQKGVGIKAHNSGNQVGIGLLVIGEGGRRGGAATAEHCVQHVMSAADSVKSRLCVPPLIVCILSGQRILYPGET